MKLLKQGAKGVEVRILQLLLNVALSPTIKLRADGDFGPNTAKAVRALQQKFSLQQDGVVGSDTWKALGMTHHTFPKLSSPLSWLELARAEVGVKEILGPQKHNARIVQYHATTTLKATTDEIPWCSSFVNWVMVQVGKKGTNNALAKSWLNWGVEDKQGREGAIAVIRSKKAAGNQATGSSTGYHVAFLVRKTPTHITLLGGNQNDQVKESTYALSAYEICGYRWPL